MVRPDSSTRGHVLSDTCPFREHHLPFGTAKELPAKLSGLVVLLRRGVRREELLLACEVMLRRDQVCLRLAEVGGSTPDVGRFDHREGGAPPHVLPERRLDPGDAAGTGEKTCVT